MIDKDGCSEESVMPRSDMGVLLYLQRFIQDLSLKIKIIL